MPTVKASPDEYPSDDAVKSLIDGLSRIEGQVRAVKRMVEERRCCDQVLTQTAAARSALNRVTVKLVEAYCAGVFLRSPEFYLQRLDGTMSRDTYGTAAPAGPTPNVMRRRDACR